MKYPGVCQTAPCRAPYFYEEDNWVDDMELAGIQLFNLTSDKKYLDYAVNFGESEPITPWMGSDTAKHYQWYPFLNLGHFYLTQTKDKNVSKKFISFLKSGIERVQVRAKKNPFLIGIPFIWCSNNLVSAMLTQIRLYSKITKDNQYNEMEASLRDWLFGCNPWGTSMIIGLPKNGDYPSDPHSAFTRLGGYSIDGGLVDGPVYSSIYNNLIGIKLYAEDEYKDFQSDFIVYHDDYGDYSTNEPTMDGTASLTFYLSSLEASKRVDSKFKGAEINASGIYRFDKSKRQIFLVFTGHEYADGAEHIRKVLKKHRVKASFFFTGDFYRNLDFKNIINELIKDGHYLGAHSDKHLLYADWIKRDSTLVTKEEFIDDLKNNYKEMKKFGISPKQAKFFLPPFEWYNQEISNWTNELGLKLINFTPGTSSNADYTIPTMNNYISSEIIFNKILDYEKQDNYGLNGFILLMHIGTHPARKDKFYFKLDSLISNLKSKGYEFRKLE
ncbi:MAG: glycoside hydrolase family 9 protein, partial [Ignavibacteria bacterium]|nr:glycoside hydrolase family 9 protein [Ignavibacteria bacterium]